MAAPDGRPNAAKPKQDYRKLPPDVCLDGAVASLDANPVPDLESGRNVDQHRALRDD